MHSVSLKGDVVKMMVIIYVVRWYAYVIKLLACVLKMCLLSRSSSVIS